MTATNGTTGYVYCMSNECIPGLVKVGFTFNDPSTRAKELYTTGVPMPFKVEFAKKVLDPEDKERKLHALLTKHFSRPNGQREFFRCMPSDAKEFFDLLDGPYQMTSLQQDLAKFLFKGL